MKLSVCSGIGSLEKPNIEFFKMLKESGFDAVDLGLWGGFNYDTEDQLKAACENYRKAANEEGMVIGQTHAAFSGHPRDNQYDYENIEQRQIKDIKITRWLGCNRIVIHPNVLQGNIYNMFEKYNFPKLVEMYAKLTPVLEEYDVYCCIENMWNWDSHLNRICATSCSRATELRALADALGERFKVCIDTGHGELTGENPVEMVRTVGDKLGALHCHATNCRDDFHTLPYLQGPFPPTCKHMIDWEAFMKALAEVGYTDTLNFEVSPPGDDRVSRLGYKYLAEIGKYLVSVYEQNRQNPERR